MKLKNIDDIKTFLKKINKYDILYDGSSSYAFSPNNISNIESKNSILLVSHELSRTGAPIVVLDTAKVLVKQGFFVVVISTKDGELLDEFLSIGVPVVVMPEIKCTQYLHNEVDLFTKTLDLDEFVNSFNITFFVTATLYNFVRRYYNSNNKIIWWIHEGSESYNILGKKMPKTITKNVTVLTGGQYSADQLNKLNFKYYPKVLNYGVYDEKKHQQKEKKENNDKVKFLIAGTIGVRKGQLVLLEAIKLLPDDINNNSEFIFIGDPYENDRTGEEIKKIIYEYSLDNKNVKLLKSMDRKSLYKMYGDIDVLVVASIDDPMPVVATENFMLGNICLCSDCTGTSYYITDKKNGFVFKSGDVEELSKKIEYIVSHKKELDTIKQNGRKIFENYFEMSIFSKNILKIVKDRL